MSKYPPLPPQDAHHAPGLRLAFIDGGNLVLEVQQRRHAHHAVALGHLGVLGLDELDAYSVRVVIDVLQLLENLHASAAGVGVFIICRVGEGESELTFSF